MLFEKTSFHFVSAQTFTFIQEFVVGLNGGGEGGVGPAGKAEAADTPTIEQDFTLREKTKMTMMSSVPSAGGREK